MENSKIPKLTRISIADFEITSSKESLKELEECMIGYQEEQVLCRIQKKESYY